MANPFVNTARDPVRDQYERWPYPPGSDDPAALANYMRLYGTLRNLTPRYWPAGKPREDLRILVAGCGTVSAACYASNFPECQVTGLDLSQSSLECEKKLQKHLQLQNLTLHRGSIEDAAGLGMTFDYVACQGVLHHTQNPAQALRVLGNLLSEEGVICLSLYGKFPRSQVYAFQELFRLLRLDQSPESIAIVRQTLSSLSPDHPLQSFLRHSMDHRSDEGLVDMFLHPRDRAYSVTECQAVVAEAGLVFQGWDMNFNYHPDGPYCGNVVLRDRLNALSDEQTWQAMEIISGNMRMHDFHVCRPDRDPATYRIPWSSERLLDCIPGICVDLMKIGGSSNEPGWAMGRGPLPPVPLTPSHAAIFSRIDGRRTIRECLVAAGAQGPMERFLNLAEPLLRLLWRTGYGVLYLPRTRPATNASQQKSVQFV